MISSRALRRAALRTQVCKKKRVSIQLNSELTAQLCSYPQLSSKLRTRYNSTVAASEQAPPPADGSLPGLATSPLLYATRDAALKTPGLSWLDEDEPSPGGIISGRETRKMNTYQAIRDAMR